MSHRGSFEVLVPLFSLKVSLLGLIGSKGLTSPMGYLKGPEWA